MTHNANYATRFPDDSILSLRDVIEFTVAAEMDAMSVFSGETLLGYLLAIRDLQLACCKKQIIAIHGSNGMEK